MERFRALDRYPKIILIALAVMAVVFSALYGITASRVGYLYCETILIPRQEGDATLYEGRLGDADCTFTVTADTVTLVCGRTYGPYTLLDDPTAIPEDHAFAPYMTGIVITDGAKTFFRGGMMENGDGFSLYQEDGTPQFYMSVTMSDGTTVDMNGGTGSPFAPTAHDIVELLQGPELIHRAQWPVLAMAIFFSLIIAVDILFADELFRLSLSFRVRDAYTAEPSDWELAGRAIGWTIAPILAFIIYMWGLNAV